MKKAIITAIIAGMLLTGCAGANAEAAQVSQTAGAARQPAAGAGGGQATTVSTQDGSKQAGDVSDQGGTPGQTAQQDVKMVYGEITELIGNAVTVKEIEMKRRQFEMTEGEMPEGFTPGEMPEGGFGSGEMGEMPEGGFGSGEMGEMPEGFTPGEGGGTGMTGERVAGRDGSGETREPNYTGEEIEIFIPVGLPVTTMQAADGGAYEMKEIKLEDIKIGDMITALYNEDGATIASVSVTQKGAAGSSMGMGGGREGEFIFHSEVESGVEDGTVTVFTVGEP